MCIRDRTDAADVEEVKLPEIRLDAVGHQVIEGPVDRRLPKGQVIDEWITHRDLSVNAGTGAVVAGGRKVDLGTNEFALLTTLMESGRRVRSTANLVLTLRGESYVTTYYVNQADKNVVNQHMKNLRVKLGDTEVAPRWIETVRGVGYRMTET